MPQYLPLSNMFRKTNSLSISVLVFQIVTFMFKKISSLWIFSKMLQNNWKASFNSIWLTFGRKTFLFNIYPLLMVWSKELFKQIQIYLRICPFSNMVRKTHFLSISVHVFEIDSFMSKKKSSLWIAPKLFQKTERHSIAVCGSLCGEKQFLLLFIPFYWFEQKKLFK